MMGLSPRPRNASEPHQLACREVTCNNGPNRATCYTRCRPCVVGGSRRAGLEMTAVAVERSKPLYVTRSGSGGSGGVQAIEAHSGKTDDTVLRDT